MKRKGRRWGWVGIGVITACVVALAYYHWWGPGSLPRVRVARVARGDLRLELSATGVVKAREVQISSETPARIRQVLVAEGQQVEPGQTLVMLDRAALAANLEQARANLTAARVRARQAHEAVEAERKNTRGALAAAEASLRVAQAQLERLERGARPQEIAAAQARVEQAVAQLDHAERDLARFRQLHADGAVSAQMLDAARTARDVAAAQVRAAQQALRLTEEGPRAEDIAAGRAQVEAARGAREQARALQHLVDLRQREAQAAQAQARAAQGLAQAAQAELDRADIRAPMAGTVVRVDAEPGEVAYPGVPLMVLSDLSRMWVEAEIDDVDLDKIAVGHEVAIYADAFPGRAFAGRVFEMAKAAQPKMFGRTQARIVRAKVRLLEAAPFTAEMEVAVESRPVVARDALLAPNQAVRRQGDVSFVFVLDGKRVRRRDIRVGERSFDHTRVIAGLEQGEHVALPGEAELRDGQRVRVAKGGD